LHSLTWLADVALNRLKQGNTEKLEQSLHQITQSSRQALKEMRLLLYESLAQITGKLPLVEALTLRLEAVEQRAGLQTKLEIDDEREWPIEWEAELFAITIEALNNALKHARANQVNIRLRGGETWFDLEIEDDGIGFDPDHIPGGGMGLRNIRERAATLGGSLEINSTLKKGTRIHVKIGQIHPEPTAETGEPK
jgi:signal transduction histidine kinase